MKKFKNCHVVYLIIALILVVAGILFYPNLTNLGLGERFLDLIVAGFLLLYLISFVIPYFNKFDSKASEYKVVLIVELVAISYLLVSNVLSFFNVMGALPINKVFGIVIWVRGVSLLISCLYGRSDSLGKLSKYIDIILISCGVYFFFVATISEGEMLRSLCWLFFVLALILIIYAIVYWPKKTVVRKETIKKVTKTKSSK